MRTVHLEHPPLEGRYSVDRLPRWETETWISILEQTLLTDFQNYQIEVVVENQSYHTIAKATIVFATIEDAAWFKLQHLR